MKKYQKGLLYGAIVGLVISVIIVVIGHFHQVYYEETALSIFIEHFFSILYFPPSMPGMFVEVLLWGFWATYSPFVEAIRTIVPAVVGYSIIGLLLSLTKITKRAVIILSLVVVICVVAGSWYSAFITLKENKIEYACNLKYGNPNNVCTAKEFMDGTYRCRDLQTKVENDITKCISDNKEI